MGLDCSHDAFHGAYSAFNRFRQAVAKVCGGSYPPHEDKRLIETLWYFGDGYNEEQNPGLKIFFAHSDCDGDIGPEDCVKVADELEQLLPALYEMGSGGGHIERAGGYGGVASKFIAGCRLAAREGERLDFH